MLMRLKMTEKNTSAITDLFIFYLKMHQNATMGTNKFQTTQAGKCEMKACLCLMSISAYAFLQSIKKLPFLELRALLGFQLAFVAMRGCVGVERLRNPDIMRQRILNQI